MSHGKKPTRCEMGWQNLPRNSRRSCKGPLKYEGKFLLCEEHRLLVDRIVAAANRRMNAIRAARRFEVAA